jgi:hypothetical protein
VRASEVDMLNRQHSFERFFYGLLGMKTGRRQLSFGVIVLTVERGRSDLALSTHSPDEASASSGESIARSKFFPGLRCAPSRLRLLMPYQVPP